MTLVVKIDNEHYERIMRIEEGVTVYPTTLALYEAVKNGTPLPKGHGRLIDVNDLLDDINLEDNDYNRDINTGEIITLENIDRIPTIIEADREEEE